MFNKYFRIVQKYGKFRNAQLPDKNICYNAKTKTKANLQQKKM